ERRDVRHRAALLEDEGHFLAAVDVDDRDQHVAAEGQGGERDDGFAPVGELEGDCVSRLYAHLPKETDEPARLVVDVGIAALPTARSGPDGHRRRGVRGELAGHHRAEGVLRPPAALDVRSFELRRNAAHAPPFAARSGSALLRHRRSAAARARRSSFTTLPVALVGNAPTATT